MKYEYGAFVTEKPEVLGKPVPVPVCPLPFPQRLVWDRTLISLSKVSG